MTQDTKTAIQSAEERLTKERKELLQQEIYNYLKQELEAIDEIDSKISKLKTDKIAHEENIKNLKAGNLEAIEKRRQSYSIGGYSGITFDCTVPYINGTNFYNNYVAGITYTTGTGKTYIF